jgi:serine/threonine protein kinase
MSPELIAGQPYTYASDVWALGCIAYELASGGVRAFESDSLPQLMCKVMTGDYPPVPSHFSRQFERIVAAMLDPDPHERPTAGALLRHPFVRTHCEAWLAESSSSSPRDTTRGRDGDPAETRTESNKSNEPNNKPAARSSSVSPRNHQLVLPPLDPIAIEDAAARASRSIAAVARKVRVSEASSRTVRKKTNGPGAAAPPTFRSAGLLRGSTSSASGFARWRPDTLRDSDTPGKAEPRCASTTRRV